MSENLIIVRDQIREELTNYFPKDDHRLDEEYIEKKIINARSSIIKDFLEQNRKVPMSFFQRLQCLELKCKNAAECVPGYPADKIYYFEIPSVVTYSEFKAIEYIGSVDFTNAFHQVGLQSLINMELSGLQYHPGDTYYAISGINENGKMELLIRNQPTTGARYFGIIALFTDPVEAASLCDSAAEIVPGDWISKISIIVKKDILSTVGIPLDRGNNAKDDTDGAQRQNTDN